MRNPGTHCELILMSPKKHGGLITEFFSVPEEADIDWNGAGHLVKAA